MLHSLKKTAAYVLIAWSLPLSASAIIYKANPIGSDANFNPLSYYLNLGFDTTQNPNYFSQENYFHNHGVLWQRVRTPFKTIEDHGGMGYFLGTEFFGLRSSPNWTLHFIGGGYDFRWMAEWYEAHNVPYPYVFAFISAYLANIGNEAIETTAIQVNALDNIADLYFFDIAGKLLFLNDSVAGFFYNDLKMRAWHFQPMLNVRKGQIENAGCNYIFRPELFGREYRPFLQLGLTQMAGVSRLVTEEDALTAAIGVALKDPLEIEGDFIAGLMWDKRDALLASVVFNGSANLAVRLNIYPDVYNLFGFKTGIYTSYSKTSEFAFGLNLGVGAGLGL